MVGCVGVGIGGTTQGVGDFLVDVDKGRNEGGFQRIEAFSGVGDLFGGTGKVGIVLGGVPFGVVHETALLGQDPTKIVTAILGAVGSSVSVKDGVQGMPGQVQFGGTVVFGRVQVNLGDVGVFHVDPPSLHAAQSEFQRDKLFQFRLVVALFLDALGDFHGVGASDVCLFLRDGRSQQVPHCFLFFVCCCSCFCGVLGRKIQ